MSQSLLSLYLSDEDITAIDAALSGIETRLAALGLTLDSITA